MHLQAFLLVYFAFFKQAYAATDKVLCYYESGSVDFFSPDNIDVSICTHINYAFFGVNEEDGSLRPDKGYNGKINSELKQKNYKPNFHPETMTSLAHLKTKNPDLKLVISVGGWGEDPTRFSQVAADATKLATMAESALGYLQQYNFDGIDIDWEYPGRRGGPPEDYVNFIDMLSVLRQKFDDNGNYLLTTAVCYDTKCGEYNVSAISEIVDYVNVMTYDIHSPADNKTGQNSPLYASSNDTEWDKTHANCDSSVTNWINSGTAPEKITLGLAFYGHSFTLADPDDHGIGAPTTGAGKQNGNYNNVCTLTDDWTEVWDDEQQVPYKYLGNEWIGYDNPRSIGLKVQYAKSRNLAGVMMWAVDLDDGDGSCGTKNALLQAIKDNL